MDASVIPAAYGGGNQAVDYPRTRTADDVVLSLQT